MARDVSCVCNQLGRKDRSHPHSLARGEKRVQNPRHPSGLVARKTHLEGMNMGLGRVVRFGKSLASGRGWNLSGVHKGTHLVQILFGRTKDWEKQGILFVVVGVNLLMRVKWWWMR